MNNSLLHHLQTLLRAPYHRDFWFLMVMLAATSVTSAQVNNITQGTGPFATIQAAINHPSTVAGDTLTLDPGTHSSGGSTITVNKSVTILGASEATVFVDVSSNGASWGIHVATSNVTMRQFTVIPVASSGGGFPIHVSNVPSVISNIILSNITINGSWRTGFDLHGVNNATLSHLTSTNAIAGNGIQMSGCSNVTLGNITTAGNAWGGVAVYTSTPLGVASSNISLDLTTSSLGVNPGTAPYYLQNTLTLKSTNVGGLGWTYRIWNNTDFPLTAPLVDNLANALAAISLFPNPLHSALEKTDGSGWFVSPPLKVQVAVNFAASGEQVELDAGTYNERVTINKSLALQGTSEATSILDGTGLGSPGSGITITTGTTNVTIRDLTVRNYLANSPNSYAGIYAVGQNHNLFVQNVTLKDNVGGAGFYANGPVNGVTLDNLDVSGHTNAFGAARGIVIWNGLKENITITNSDVYNNNCCGIELQDGTASGVTIENNNVYNNGDNGIGVVGLQGPGENLIKKNVVTDNGRFGIEVKNPDGSGLATGPGRILVDSNNVSRTLPIGAELRDIVGIAAFRRGVLAGNVDVPYGVVIQNNTVSGYVQPSNSDGFGIVAEGMNHTISGNTVTGCDVGIQRQAGHLPYPGDGDQSNLPDQYFGRGNSPVSCGIILSGNMLSSNGVNTRDVGPGVAAGIVENTATSKEYCTIQSAINDPLTLNGHTLDIYPGLFNERVSLTKSLTLLGADEATTILDGAGLPGVGSGITIAVNLTNVTIRNLTVRNYAGSGPNSYAGIYAIGQNNNLLVRNVTIKDNLGGSGFYANGPVNGVTLDSLDVSGHTNIAGVARGIVIWNGLKENITITNSSVYNNNCCGIELQDGTASGVTIQNNNVYDNGDNGIGVVGMQAPGENLIRGNTLVNNGRFGIEVKNPSGSGLGTGPGRILVDSNNVSRTLPIGAEVRDIVGIATFRRGVLAGNVDIPVGVVIQDNIVSGYVQPSNSDGFGIVAEGINHTISGNTVTGCDVGIQRQSGHLPYPGDGDQSNLSDQYFGRGNSPVSCGITVTGNILSNTVDTRDVPGAIALKTGFVKNITTDSVFCTIQSAINAPNTVAGHTLAVNGGTYDEQVLVNKGVTIKGVSSPLPIVDFTGSVSGKPTLFDISADGVTVDSIHFNVDLSKLRSAIIASAVALDNITVTNNVIDAYGAPAGTYGDRNAVSINYGGPTNYRVASGGVDNILFSGNTVNGSLPSSFFRAAVAVDEAGGTFSGNTLQTINHDVLVRFGSNGNISITGNNLNGGGVELSDMNAGAGTLTVSGNIFDGTAAIISASGTAVLRLKNNYHSKTTLVQNNTFANHDWAVSLENYNSVTLDNNGFTPQTGSTSFHHVVINTKSISTNSSSIVQVPVDATLINNTFNWSGTFGGTALALLNHDSDAASFGTFTIGTAGNANTFNNGIQYNLFLDGESGSTLGTVFPNYNGLIGVGAGAITTKAPWSPDMNGVNNLYDVGSGAMAPSLMTLADLYALEDRVVHKVDAGVLGKVAMVPNHWYVTANSYFAPLTSAAHLQRGVDAAVNGDTVNVAPGTYRGQIYINKDMALLGSGRAVTEIVPPLAVMSQPFLPARLERPIIGVDSLGTNVIIDGFTVDGEGAGNTHGNMVGVQYFKASGIIRNNTVKRIRSTPFDGSQTNAGILVNHAFPTVYAHTVEIHDDSVYDFGKAGIVCNHPGVTGNVHNNVVIGQGPVGAGFAAQNGIQFGFGATGTIANNEVRNISYTHPSGAASSILGVATNGVLTISGNTVVEGQAGINLQQSAAYPSGSSSADVYGNTYTASTGGTGVTAYYGAITWSEGGATPPPAPSNRPLPTAPFDEIALTDAASQRGSEPEALATMTVNLADNTFSSTSPGSGYGLYMLALDTSPQTVTGDSNSFAGFEVAVVADKDPGATLNSTWRRNSFAGNTYGMYDLTGVLQDARENWWNNATGPADPKSLPATPNYNNPSATGDSVTAFVDYNPWYTDAGMTGLSYYTVTVNVSGNGSVTKAPDTTAYLYFEDVLLSAIPDPGHHFVGWTGDTTSSNNPITIKVTGDMSYTATFAPNQYPINILITGSGTVDKAPDQLLYDYGTPVTLTANPDLGWNFVAWMGDTVSASNPITVTVEDTVNIEAVFAINVYTLNVGIVGSGGVTKNPDLPGYAHGMTVGLKATPSIGHNFVGWSGDTTETADTLYLTMESDVNLTATFAINMYTLNVSVAGSGSVGKVPDLPSYPHGSNVTLTAVPYVSWSFIGWSGDTVSVDNPITLTMESNVNVTAAFTGDKFLTLTTDTLLLKGPTGRWQRPARRGRDANPNWANLLSEVVIQGGFQPNATESDSAGGMRVGLSFLRAAGGGKYRPLRDSALVYGWARLSSWKRNNQGAGWNSILKTLEDRTGVHTQFPRGLDLLFRGSGSQERVLIGERRNLPPKRYNNVLYAELIALKFNIAASQLGKTPPGLGELVFVQPGSFLNGLMVREVSRMTDSLMTYWRGRGQEDYDSLYSAIYRINRAFLGPIDTVAWVAGGQLVLNGTVGLDSISFLEGAFVPPIILDRTTDETEGDEDDFDDEEFLENGVPLAVRLDQNYPNPFNPSTTVQFRLRETAQVTLRVYDMLGREVATLLQNEVLDEGPQYVDFVGSRLSSGVYFCRVEATGIDDDPVRTVQTIKMVLLK